MNVMCRVTVEINQDVLRNMRPDLDSMAAIRLWAQKIIDQHILQMEAKGNAEFDDICSEDIGLYLQPTDLRNLELVGEEAETVDLETARTMLHQTIREEYAKA